MASKVVLITGASRGIGAAIATEFAKNGFSVILTSKNHPQLLTTLKQTLTSLYGIDCMTFVGDIGDPAQVDLLFKAIDQRYNSLDILINNAGISHIGLLSQMSNEEWNNIFATNLSSLFYTCKHAIPPMVAQQSGKIINISSVWGEVGASCEVAYSATKGGVNAFTKSLAKELAPSNIQVNAIACGIIDTQMNSCFSPDEKSDLENEIPVGRFGQPEEVAHLCLQLCTGNDYLTGQIITLNGGWY